MNVLEYMRNHFLFLDGGMGTLLQEAGLAPGELPERWNVSHPDEIIRIQKAYFDAGSNVVLANTFGANSLKFPEDELETLIRAAIKNAGEARKESIGTQPKFIGLDIGPIGRLLKPYGDLDFEEAVSIYARTVRIGAEAGAELIFIETMNDSYDTKAALLAAKENSDLPVFVSNAYGSDGKLMTGASPEAMAALLEGMGADAIGANCSLGPEQLRGVVERYLACASVPVLLKPNAGLPRSENGKTVYDILPDEFAQQVSGLMESGVRIAGGCCGTTPDYIREVVNRAKGLTPVPLTEKNRTVISSYTHAVEFSDDPVLIGERINPTGKKRFQQALRDGDIDYVLGEGLKQADAGVHVLDVNVGLPDIDEPGMLESVVKELQSVTDLPLQIDTVDISAMEKALRCYNGKALINSVNGKTGVMEAVFPLAAKYGGVVVALTLDENGIPDTAEGRVQIAKRILEKASEYGILPKDILFDPLAMTISADTRSAMTTIEAVRRIRHELGVHTSLGVSNVSFGLPVRSMITAAFFAMALEKGLSAAIMNPYTAEMMNVYHAYRALHNLDPNCESYIRYAQSIPAPAAAQGQTRSAAAAGSAGTQDVSGMKDSNSREDTGGEKTDEALRTAIVRGRKEQAGSIVKELLETRDGMDIVQNAIIPALNVVGKLYEEKKVFLPQLLMAAEASKSAFERIKDAVAADGASQKSVRCTVVIATVHGDIHDIGKNIVKLLLENYGFRVVDLGKDVPEETVVKKTVELHAPLVGLSALMTTTVPAMERTIHLRREQAPWAKIAVGGAVLTKEYADAIGADRYCRDAMETVRYAEEIDVLQ